MRQPAIFGDAVAKPHIRRAEPAPPAPAPDPKPVFRAAGPSNIGALLALVRTLRRADVDADAIARNLQLVRKAGGGTLVAELDIVVGCCVWTAIPTLQHGAVGRLTLLLVHPKFRRRGIATGLLEQASAALRKAGCRHVEVLSDIDVRNSHNFFRSSKFDQSSYRFVRTIEA